jgi:hypothetical protein
MSFDPAELWRSDMRLPHPRDTLADYIARSYSLGHWGYWSRPTRWLPEEVPR